MPSFSRASRSQGAGSGRQLLQIETQFRIEHVEHAQAAIGGLAADGERFREQIVQGLAFGQALAELHRLAGEVRIVQDFHGGGVGIDLGDPGKQAFDLALVAGPEKLG